MAKPLSAYDTKNTGAEKPDYVTKTNVDGEKVALDVAVKELIGQVTGSFTPSGLTKGGQVTVVTIDNTSWTDVTPSPLADRNAFAVQNEDSAQKVKLNYDYTGPLPAGFEGMTIYPNGERQYDIQGTVKVYAKSETGTMTVNVEQLA